MTLKPNGSCRYGAVEKKERTYSSVSTAVSFFAGNIYKAKKCSNQ
jgi:hypothetical protein